MRVVVNPMPEVVTKPDIGFRISRQSRYRRARIVAGRIGYAAETEVEVDEAADGADLATPIETLSPAQQAAVAGTVASGIATGFVINSFPKERLNVKGKASGRLGSLEFDLAAETDKAPTT